MHSARWDHLQELFHAALELAPPLRKPFLDRECAGDAGLRAEIEGFLSTLDRKEDPIAEAIGAGAGALSGHLSGWTPGDTIGAYRLIRKIGEGGMGSVYLAERADHRYNRQVAIKLLRPEIPAAGTVERFSAEVRILANLDHPNIAYLLDSGVTESGSPYLVMEYIDGVPIDEYCRERRLPVRDRVKLLRAVCAAVEHAHRNLVIHRDIKPSNILVSPEGVPKLLDFGIAKLLAGPPSQALTRPADRLLTLEYASPEQILGTPVTTATDVYGLGLVAYELLCEKRVHEAGESTPIDLSRRICETDPARPSRATENPALARELAGDLDNIVLMAIRKEPENRYRSVEQFSNDLERWMAGFPVLASKGTARYRAFKFVRRHRVAVGAAAAFILILAAFSMGMTILAAKLARERDLARNQRIRAEQVSEFLTQLFGASDPFQAKGDPVTAREILDRGAARVSRDLAGQPQARAQVLETMAQAYQHLGIYDRAEALLEEEAAAQAEAFGNGSLAAANTLRRLGDVRRQRSSLQAAESTLRQALEIQEKGLPPEDPELSHTYNNLGLVLQGRGDLNRARNFFEKAVRISRLHPDQLTETLVMKSNLGGVLSEMAEFDQAERQLREVLEERRRLLGDRHPQVLRSMRRLGSLLGDMGNLAAAGRLLQTALDGHRRILGPDHPDTLGVLNSLAQLLHDVGRSAEAEAILRDAVTRGKRALGDHADVASWQSSLAAVLRDRGEYTESERLYRESLEIYRRKLPPRSTREARLLAGFAALLMRRGSHSAAYDILAAALAIDRERLGPRHPDTADVIAQLAAGRERQNRLEDARALYSEALVIDRKVFPNGHPQLAAHLAGFSRLLIRLGEADLAAQCGSESGVMRAKLLDSVTFLGAAKP